MMVTDIIWLSFEMLDIYCMLRINYKATFTWLKTAQLKRQVSKLSRFCDLVHGTVWGAFKVILSNVMFSSLFSSLFDCNFTLYLPCKLKHIGCSVKNLQRVG